MMGIVHRALGRDLDRAAGILSQETPPGEAQRVALAEHLHSMMDFLHLHHAGEDAWLWPTMRRLNPSASEVLDQMDVDHLAIAPHMAKVAAAAEAYRRSANGLEPLVHALGELRSILDPHLRREEDEMMPLVASTLTARQWDSWEHAYYVKPKSKQALGLEGHWLIDGADRAGYDHVLGKVNPVLRVVLLRLYGPKYRQSCATRWGDHVAVGPSLG
jgi:hypothetical protein